MANKTFAVCYYQGMIINDFTSREEAVKYLHALEETDMDKGIYEPGTYEIQVIPWKE